MVSSDSFHCNHKGHCTSVRNSPSIDSPMMEKAVPTDRVSVKALKVVRFLNKPSQKYWSRHATRETFTLNVGGERFLIFDWFYSSNKSHTY